MTRAIGTWGPSDDQIGISGIRSFRHSVTKIARVPVRVVKRSWTLGSTLRWRSGARGRKALRENPKNAPVIQVGLEL